MSDPLLSQLAERLARPVEEGPRQRARLHLLDWLACIAGARQSEAGELGAVISHAGWERATYLGNVLGREDSSPIGGVRPGPVVWPAALSMGSAAMDARLDAAIRGYEAMIAVAASLDEYHSRHWNASATAGLFGACAAFGSLIGFAPVEYVNAMGNAGSVGGGLLQGLDGELLTRQWQVYHAVRTGRDAAMHVHYGATGPLDLLEGESGLFAAMTDRAQPLGEPPGGWLIEQVLCLPADSDDEHGASREPASAAQSAKIEALASAGLLGPGEAERAVNIALHGNDGGELDALLNRWLGG